jgi:hypothetical protein
LTSALRASGAERQVPNAWDLTAHRTFVSHGVCIGIRASDPTLLDRAQACLPPGWQASHGQSPDACYSIVGRPVEGGGRIVYELDEDGARLAEGFRLTRVLDAMDSAIRQRVAGQSPDRLFVHAGAVEWKGRCIVLPGASGAGKTSLVVALVRAGAAYCSDEYAVLDDRGFVHPYARLISCRQGAHRRFSLDVEADLGGRQADAPLPISLVVHTRYRAAARWEPRVVAPGESALGMFANALAARERPAFAFSTISRALSGAVSLQGERGEADAAAGALLNYAAQLSPLTRGT